MSKRGKCAGCGREMVLVAKGKCWKCYRESRKGAGAGAKKRAKHRGGG